VRRLSGRFPTATPPLPFPGLTPCEPWATPPSQPFRPALKSARVQELNRQKSGFASSAVARSIAARVEWLNGQIEAVMDEAPHIVATDAALSKNPELIRSITGLGGVAEGSMRVARGMATEGRFRQPSCWPSSLPWHSTRCAAGTLASVVIPTATPPEPSTTPPAPPNIADFTPKALTAFVGLSPPAYSTGFAGGTLTASAQRAQLRHVRAQARQGQPYRNRTPAQHTLHVRPQRQTEQQATCRLRRAHARRRRSCQRFRTRSVCNGSGGKPPKVILVTVPSAVIPRASHAKP